MSHTPFILGSYAIAVLVLGWCALAPVVRAKTLKRQLCEKIQREAQRASDS